MRKKILSLALAVLMLSVPGKVHAETSTVEGSVTFTNENKLDSNGTADLNAAVGALQPGDEIIIEIAVGNTSGKAANYYMTNEVVNSLEDTEGSNASGGAYEYVLTYTASDGTTTDLFRSTALGGSGATVDGRVGLKGATSGLEEYIYLETLESGKQGTVRLQVGLDGETQGNSYQGTAANLEMNFAVDTDTTTVRNVTQTVTRNETIEVVDDTNPGGNGDGNGDGDGSGQRNGTVVRTSDDTNLTPFFIAAGVSGILLLVLAIFGVKERKKQRKAGAALGICLALVFSMAAPNTAQAAYTYTIRLYAGAQGTILSTDVVTAPANATVTLKDGGACLEVTGLNYEDMVTFNANVAEGSAQTVGVNADPATGTSKYNVRGVRESGAEIDVVIVPVREDKDYVVSYSVNGSMAYYTVNYVDQQGNTLFPSQRYSGKIGDFAVVGYRYVEGFQPYAYNLGKTLTENEADNVFNFVYTPLPETVNTTTQTVTNTTTVVVPGQPVEEEPEPETPVVVVPPAEPETPVEPVVDIPDEPTPEAEPTPPEDFVNLDEEPTPLAPGEKGDDNGDGQGEKSGLEATIEDFATPLAALPIGAKAGIGVCAIMAVGAVVWFLIAHYRKKETKEDDAQ